MSVEAGVQQDVARRVGVGHRERPGSAGRLVVLLGRARRTARRSAARGTATRCRSADARRPSPARRRARAPRGRCAAPRPGWRRTSSRSARRRGRSAARTAAPASTSATAKRALRDAGLRRLRDRGLDEARRRVDADRLALRARRARRSAGSCRRTRSRCRARARPAAAGGSRSASSPWIAEARRHDVAEAHEAVEQRPVPRRDRLGVHTGTPRRRAWPSRLRARVPFDHTPRRRRPWETVPDLTQATLIASLPCVWVLASAPSASPACSSP